MPRERRTASARAIALDVLNACLGEHPQPAEAVFDAHPDLSRLSARDRAFARALYAATLRRLGSIDRTLKSFVQRPPTSLALENCLRLGTAQLYALQTPPHAAISTTVDLAKRVAPFGAKMVNAVLRKVSRAAPPKPDPVGELPLWLRESWQQAYGPERAAAIAEASLCEAPLDLTCRSDREVWASRLGAQAVGRDTLRLGEHGSITELPGFNEGAWWVQDAAAAAIVPLLGDVRGKRVLDLCAAPGGKTMQLAAVGADVVAVERSAPRSKRLADNLKRLGLMADIRQADVLEMPEGEPFDAVLLDAPCTATGTIRRHPDILWARRPVDVQRLAATQCRLLAAAARHVRREGALVYAVCSLQTEEGPAQIRAFLEHHPGWRRRPVQPAELHGLPAETTIDGDFRALPCHAASIGGMDGFFAARLIQA